MPAVSLLKYREKVIIFDKPLQEFQSCGCAFWVTDVEDVVGRKHHH
jgi:hypothetical protein